MFPSLRLSEIDFRDGREVIPLLEELHSLAFPQADDSYIAPLVRDVQSMFHGENPYYQRMDTAYHDLVHTLQATLCWTRLIVRRHLCGALPVIDAHLFKIGLAAVLMHDIGYLKERGDTHGTGAKYTFVHERRSCELALMYLVERGWKIRDIFMVQHLISCTGPLARLDAIPFFGPVDRMLGQAVCSADYLGQMSDPDYVDKLPALFKEFTESDDFRGIPRERRLFNSYEQLLRQTPAFWENVVRGKLETDCGAMHRFLCDPYPDGANEYVDAIDRNIGIVRQQIAELAAHA